MTGIAGRHVVLGVSGGIAIYKACALARRLTEAGARVDVVMTASATEFIRPLTFEALTGRPVVTSLWDSGRALDHTTSTHSCMVLEKFCSGISTSCPAARRTPAAPGRIAWQ